MWHAINYFWNFEVTLYIIHVFFLVSPSTNQLLTPQINHISMQIPSFPLLPQRDEVSSDMFCNENTLKETDCNNSYCECPHVYQVRNYIKFIILLHSAFNLFEWKLLLKVARFPFVATPVTFPRACNAFIKLLIKIRTFSGNTALNLGMNP